MKREIVATIPERTVREALMDSRGNIKKAAEVMNVDRTALANRIHKSEDLEAHLKTCREMKYEDAVDEAEDIIEKARSGESCTRAEVTAAIFTLKTHGKKRGWVERQEVTGGEGKPLGLLVAPMTAKNPQDLKQMAKEQIEQAQRD